MHTAAAYRTQKIHSKASENYPETYLTCSPVTGDQQNPVSTSFGKYPFPMSAQYYTCRYLIYWFWFGLWSVGFGGQKGGPRYLYEKCVGLRGVLVQAFWVLSLDYTATCTQRIFASLLFWKFLITILACDRRAQLVD